MNLRDNIDDLTRQTSELEAREGCVLASPGAVEGLVWDVGANVGLYSVRAAQLGRQCIAFEFAPKACAMQERTKRHNNLTFTIVNRAFTTEPIQYSAPASASSENALTPSKDGAMTSITYLEAAEKFGLPALIKMDIEGGEQTFFQSSAFKQWLVQHQIAWLVEIHERQLGYIPEWDDVPHCTLRENHVLYAACEESLRQLENRIRESGIGRTPPHS